MEKAQENESSLSTPLIQIPEKITDEKDSIFDGKEVILEEFRKQLWLAGPMVSVSLLQFCLQLISVMFVGHLGELALSGASMATSFASVTGFSLLMGMASALDTLCGQSYGAKQYHMLGIQMQRAMFVLLLVGIPLAIIWANTGTILTALGQDPDISREAGLYARFMIPSIFAYGLLQCQVKFLQTQNIVFPMMISSGITTLLHLFLCWTLVLKSGLGSRGAAVANCISYWINVFLLFLYIKFSLLARKLGLDFRKKPYTMSLILSDLPSLQQSWSAHESRMNWGPGVPRAARLAVGVVLFMAISEGILVGMVLLLIRNIWGYAYSNEIEVVTYVATMMPILAASNFMDGLQCVLSGTVRGCGWQKIGAFINLGSYYLVGIPVAILLAFVLHIGGKGLWLGILCALSVQVVCLLSSPYALIGKTRQRRSKRESMTPQFLWRYYHEDVML
ncbi:hypothetical protein DH2020_038581 [Rehmannia glutinosa]|uniref:Protein DETOXIFICATION n=1 Tax=Rehmannia glutinosa TaxID=99300 RepID=A0ABR0V0B9_REHGL